ncbi:peptide chain release factor N(5)-glutamine methyltransferase [Hoyosella sp. G463]|uniref:Release factor glutamine methyltransferase n=1 Tax=Lolliginicoccus lacisalsi TaxID=2742202 RepID=A0A927JEH9_9ACTN|nr:peptide chain release factor N(5)-glutamine methyltransferase [Lolliginicoccus lacisalsi]
MTRQPVRSVISSAADALASAGVPSPRVDAELLVAHVLQVDRGRIAFIPFLTGEQGSRLQELVAQRAERVPLQYLTGTALMGEVDLAVGPGVFIPRPETELLYAWALGYLEMCGMHPPVVVDLCAGSGALALAIAHARPDAQVHAVELDKEALPWLQRNAGARQQAGDPAVTLHEADATAPGLLGELAGTVDLVISNPPYVPEGSDVAEEVARHEPRRAVFAGEDGLDVIRPLVRNAARLLRPGGGLAIEHDDSNGAGVIGIVEATKAFREIEQHFDLAGRPRFVSAIRTIGAAE